MPNSAVFRRPFRRRGQNWLPPTKPPLADVTGSGGVQLGGAATVGYGDHVGAITGSGGVHLGGTGAAKFVHTGQVASDIVVEWDFDNDGDFSEQVENITPFVLSAETFTGRDWPSLLTGRAGPGKLRASLRNDDDRFSFFNTGSPLVTAPYSLHTGRKLRVRASSASSPDPARVGRDRFRRTAGTLGEDEFGNTYSEPLAGDFTISAQRAVATSEGDTHVALIDAGGDGYYAQVKVSVLGQSDNRVGVIYRYVDSDDYSLMLVDVANQAVMLADVTAGVETILAARGMEVYSGITVGVLVDGDEVTGYVEGSPLLAAAAVNASAELVGFYAEWATGDDRPEVDEFFTWDGLPATVDGVLWTGDVADLVGSVEAGPRKAAMVAGEGWLSKLSTQQITPPTSLTGRKTGLLVGNILARSLLLHPPGRVDEGDVTTGVFAITESSGMAIARSVEETEFGFLHEAQEGYVSFLARTHRDGATSAVTFTDAADGKFGYHRLEPYDWRKEVFNRVSAGISPWTEGEQAVLATDPGPYVLAPGESRTLRPAYDGTVARWMGHTRDVKIPSAPSGISATTDSDTASLFEVALPGTVNDGDLLLILIGDPHSSDNWDGQAPSEWVLLGKTSAFGVVAKVADGSEGGGTAAFATGDNTSDGWVAHVYRVTSWFGTLDGVEISTFVAGTSSSPNPPALSPSWGATSTLFITGWKTANGTATQSGVPAGYSSGTSVSTSGGNTCSMGSARRVAAVSSEDPGAFALSTSRGWSAVTIAVRGGVTTSQVAGSDPSGNDGSFTISYVDSVGGGVQSHENIQISGVPLVQGDQTFAQADDYDSQDEHNAIRTYTNSANLFANEADAETYAQLVLATYADDRPIVAMSFYATKSKAYRKQALTRRVGDRITLVANHTSGFGIERDFYIESISHKFSHGTRLWEVTWELSPA